MKYLLTLMAGLMLAGCCEKEAARAAKAEAAA